MAAGETLTLSGGADYVFSSSTVYSAVQGNGSTQGIVLNTAGMTLTVTTLDHVYGGTQTAGSGRREVITLGSAGGNTLGVRALETVIGSAGNDVLLLASTGQSMQVESIETLVGASLGTNLVVLSSTAGNTMSVDFIKSIVGSSGKDVITFGTQGTTTVVTLMETLIGQGTFDFIATVGGGQQTVMVQGIEIFLGNGAGQSDVVHIATTGTTMGVSFTETLIGSSANDVIAMGYRAGSVTLLTGGGTLSVSMIDHVAGGTGTRDVVLLRDVGTTITVADIDTLIGGSGVDVVTMDVRRTVAAVGSDALPVATVAGTMNVALIETLIGTANTDIVTLTAPGGTNGNTISVSLIETLSGALGHDVVTIATTGNTMLVSLLEELTGGAGEDVITLGAVGNTTTFTSIETLIGGAGNDVVTFTGTEGTIFVSGVETVQTQYQTLAVGGADQTIVIGAIPNILYLPGGGGSVGVQLPYETVVGDAGVDVVTFTQTQGTTMAVQLLETLIGSAENDVVTTTGTTGNTMLVSLVENLRGGSGKDVITLGSGGNTLAVAGLETLTGGSGTDVVSGQAGLGFTMAVSLVETVVGSTVTDVITHTGDAGSTMLVSALETLVGGSGSDVVRLGTSGNTMTLSRIESVVGGIGTDVVRVASSGGTFAVSAIESLFGGIGTDVIVGTGTGGSTLSASGLEMLVGGAGLDVVSLGSSGATMTAWLLETVIGNIGRDVLTVATAGGGVFTAAGTVDVFMDGGAGNDTLTGGAGADTLIGGSGSDVMTGGAGADVFDVTSGDTIEDFTDDLDTIRVSGAVYAEGDISISDSGADAILSIGSGSPILVTLTGRAGLTMDTVVVTSSGGATLISTFSNAAPTQPTDANGAANTVVEGAADGATVGLTATSTDLDGDSISYSLTDDAGGRFTIDATTGVVTVADGSLLNYEGATSHDITVQASDGIGQSTQTFTITVTNAAPSQPTDGNVATNTVVEGAADGSTVGVTATASDPGGGTVTYSLTDDAGGRFAIDATTGVVTVADGSLLNYEGATSHDITVRVSDGVATSSQTFTIAVTNAAPSQPTDGNGATNTVVEGAADGTTVGVTATATDPSGGTVTYSLTDDAGGRFAIDATTGVVTVADGSLLNYEGATSHDITVRASDGVATSSQTFTIAVTNAAPSQPTDSNSAANTVVEAAANGTTVGVTATASDPNGGTVTYSLTDDAGGRFAIDATTGVVTVADGTLLDRNAATSHSITVRASDGVATSSQTFTIAVVNAAPTQPTDSNVATNAVAEGAANGATVGLTAAATHPTGASLTYSLTDDAGGRFAIDATTGVVTVADGSLLNYEGAASHDITVQASDGVATSSQTFTIAVTNAAPTQPTDGNVAANRVVEGAANGTVVGVTASASDPNGGTVTYSLTDDAGGRFAIDATTGVVTVADGSLLNHEGAASHSITVRASDGVATSSQTFTIAVTNAAPTQPTDGNVATNRVVEGAANGTTVGVAATASDPNGGTVTYSLTDDAGGRFAIDATTGVVTVADGSLLNYEGATSHSITVRASDGAATSSQTFTIAVTNAAPTQAADSNAATNTVVEGAADGSTVGVTASATDPNGGTVRYSLNDDAGGRFAINATTGVVTVADGSLLNYEDATSHAITVRASDGAATSSQTFTIAVTNAAPTRPTDSNAATNRVVEGAATGTVVGLTASASDPSGGTVRYSLTDDAGGRFAINARTGVVTVADGSLLNRQDAASHSITVRASDGVATSSQTFTIAVAADALYLPARGATVRVDSYSSIVGNVGTDVVTFTRTQGTTMAVSLLETLVGSTARDVVTSTGAAGSTMLVSRIESLVGGRGRDVLTFAAASTTVLSGVEKVVGSRGRDRVTLGSGGNTLAVTGLESVTGGAGRDVVTLQGQGATTAVSGVERLVGGRGTDLIFLGNAGVTMLAQGIDVLVGGSGKDVVTLAGQNTVMVRGLETLTGGNGVDIVSIGNSGATMMVAGIEQLVGGASREVVSLGSGGVTMLASGIDTLVGGAGVDVLRIGTGSSLRFEGGGGADRITLAAAAKADQIVFSGLGDGGAAGRAAGFDQVVNFQTGTDEIVLTDTLRRMLDSNRNGQVDGGVRGTGQINLATDEVVRLSGTVASLNDAGLADVRAAIGTLRNPHTGGSVLVLASNGTGTGIYMVTKNNGGAQVAASEIRLLGVMTNNNSLNGNNVIFGS
ncbi:cadherin domain-containing protein [Novispirillum sp. DQ9]|uniref:cadherin domain-containing protein n=1 Tax=Novispirillum sp. DQ9 TaxID=3398612 RepID=UPI003C7D73BE